MRQKLEDEIARFNIFQRSVLGSMEKIKNTQDTDIRNYAKYLLRSKTPTKEAGPAVARSARPQKRPFRIEKLPKNLKKYRLELHFGPKGGFPHF